MAGYVALHLACAWGSYILARKHTRRYFKWTAADRSFYLMGSLCFGPGALFASLFMFLGDSGGSEEAKW